MVRIYHALLQTWFLQFLHSSEDLRRILSYSATKFDYPPHPRWAVSEESCMHLQSAQERCPLLKSSITWKPR